MATLAIEEDDDELLQLAALTPEAEDNDLWGELLRTKSIGCQPTTSASPSMEDANKTELRKNERYIIGRDAKQAHVVIPDQHVSSKHCVIYRDEHDKHVVWVEDFSLSGTFVNGQRVGKHSKRRLANGDTITLLHASAANLSISSSSPRRTTPHKSGAASPVVNFYEFVFRDLTPKQGPCKGEINLKYDVLEEIGAGSFATVRKGVAKQRKNATPTQHEQVAIKIVLRKQFEFAPSKWKDQLKEIEMLKRVQHPMCVQLLDTYEVEEALYIVMEFVQGGELFDRILNHGALSDAQARTLTRRLLEAVHYLHLQGIVHRDLKPENILLVHRNPSCLHIKVADFGVARLVDGNGCKTVTGSMAYLAPEVLDRRDTVRGEGTYGFEVDLWSVGVVMYVCLLARLPFHDVERSGDLASAVRRMFASDELASMTDLARDFLARLLTVDSKGRLDAAGALQHEWIAQSLHCCDGERAACEQECAACDDGTAATTTTVAAAASKRAKPDASSQPPPVPLFSSQQD